MGTHAATEVGLGASAHRRRYQHLAAETLPREQLAALQLSRLQSVARDACERVAFHRERFATAGIEAEDIQSLDDIERLPFMAKSDLREHYPFRLFARPHDELVRIHASSGTTGKPTVVAYTARDIDNWAELMARSFAAAASVAATSCTTRTAMGSSRADSAHITARNGSARSSFPCRADRPSDRSR